MSNKQNDQYYESKQEYLLEIKEYRKKARMKALFIIIAFVIIYLIGKGIK